MSDTTVTVYRYRVFDPELDEWVVQLSKNTEAHIQTIGGRIITGTAEQVPLSALDAQRHYLPP